MRCAVSFLTVIVISIAVGVMALLIIWSTDSEDYCTGDKTFRCLDNGRCLKPNQSCNNFSDCDDGSDEAISYCRDLETLPTLIEIMMGGHNGEQGRNITSKPEICEYITSSIGLPRGIKCHGRSMNETWDTIPWHEFDLQAKTIVVDNGAINTSKLVETPDVHLRFSNLLRLYIENNTIGSIQDNVFCHMEAPFLKWLIMSNNLIVDLSSGSFACMNNTRVLRLAKNKLHLRGFHFTDLPILKFIDLDENEIGEITENTFSEISSLVVLQLSRNRIRNIHKDAFVHNTELKQLDLSHNLLHAISPSLFHQNIKLEKLNITRNADLRLPYYLFQTLANLKSLDIESLDLAQFNASSFIHFTPSLDIVYFKKFTYCRLIPRARRCFPYSDGLSSNSNLLVGQSRVAAWLVGLLTLFGNISVLADRLRRRPAGRAEMTQILNIFVTNLAAADLLMGVYLLSLAFKDVEYRGTYSVYAYKWGISSFCSIIGILGVISSEVSLLILTIMSLERYLSIGPLSQSQNLNINLARASMLIIWIFAGVLAIAPAIQWHDGYAPFYGTTGLCFPIHLDDRYPTGWQYTTFVFIGVNSCCLVLITVSYSLLYWTVRNTQNRTPLLKRNIELAARFFLMVFTDVLCWAPIIFLKGFVLGGHELSNEIVSYAVIYLLPLNSAVNPILYTFSTKEKRAMIKTYITDFLDNLEMSRMAPSPPNNENSMELHCMTRSLFGGSRSGRLRKDQEHPNTGGTEDTELTHSACPTVSAPESRSWYSS